MAIQMISEYLARIRSWWLSY